MEELEAIEFFIDRFRYESVKSSENELRKSMRFQAFMELNSFYGLEPKEHAYGDYRKFLEHLRVSWRITLFGAMLNILNHIKDESKDNPAIDNDFREIILNLIRIVSIIYNIKGPKDHIYNILKNDLPKKFKKSSLYMDIIRQYYLVKCTYDALKNEAK